MGDGSVCRMQPAPPPPDPGRGLVREARVRMIRETSAFLTWALAEDRDLPRIPRRRSRDGGFSALLRRPGGRALADRWWQRTLEVIGRSG